MQRILVLAVHPDDETLGCGGTLLRHKAEGDEVHWLIATSISEEEGHEAKVVSGRRQEIEDVSRMYGFDRLHAFELPTTKLDTVPRKELVEKIAGVISSVEPEIIYLPFMQDAHSDHRVLFEAAHSCTKTFRYPFIKRILMMETVSETEFAPGIQESSFVPNYFVDVGPFMDKKCAILRLFKTEVSKHPFPRSDKNIRALATFRGAMAGCEYAEAFMLLKEIR